MYVCVSVRGQACTFAEVSVFMSVCVCACVCQTGVYKSLLCPRQVYLLMYSCSECKSTDLQTDIVS